jgi:hypothetical protein
MPLFVTRRDRRVDSGFLCSQHIIADFLFFCFSNLEILSPFLSKLSSSFSVQTNRRKKKEEKNKKKENCLFLIGLDRQSKLEPKRNAAPPPGPPPTYLVAFVRF